MMNQRREELARDITNDATVTCESERPRDAPLVGERRISGNTETLLQSVSYDELRVELPLPAD